MTRSLAFLAVSLAGLAGCSESPSTSGPSGDPTPSGTGDVAQIAGCAVFPADNPWNRDVSRDPVDPRSDAYIASMNGASRFLHPDFGSDPTLRHPLDDACPAASRGCRCRSTTPTRATPAPTRSRPTRPIEAGGDRHVLVRRPRRLPALRDVRLALRRARAGAAGRARSSTCARTRCGPTGWTSADAAGPADPARPGAPRRGEVGRASATRCASPSRRTQRAYVAPGHALREQRPRPRTCRRWACACG